MNNHKGKILISIMIIGIIWASITYTASFKDNTDELKITPPPVEEVENDDDGEWKLLAVINPLSPLGEATNQPGESQWLSFFMLDYGQTPDTVLANNATDWSTSGDARGYADAYGWDLNLKAEDNGYWCCRTKFNETHLLDGGEMNWSRMKVKLNITGDSVGAVDDVEEYDNSSSDGDFTMSAQGTEAGEKMVWGTFWWDDGVDGYGIALDGGLDVKIYLYAKF